MLLCIPRALCKKLEQSSHPLKEELKLCLIDPTGEDGMTDDSQDWVNEIDQFQDVHGDCYQVASQRTNILEKATPTIMANEDILFHWSMMVC